jgi:hypothetical protein
VELPIIATRHYGLDTGGRRLLEPHRERLTFEFTEEVGDLGIPELMPGGYGRAVEARLLSVLKAELEKIIAERRRRDSTVKNRTGGTDDDSNRHGS